MRFVSHWPLGVPLLFLAYMVPRKPKVKPCTCEKMRDECPTPYMCSMLRQAIRLAERRDAGVRRKGGS